MFFVAPLCCIIFALISFYSHGTVAQQDEYFSSVAGMEELLYTEAFLVNNLHSYVESMASQLEMFKRELAEIEKEHLSSSGGLEEYLTNPVNGFLLIKRLHQDWGIYADAIGNDPARKSFLDAISYSRKNLSFPSEDDAAGSAMALVRLQDTYQLDVSQVAAGILNGVKYGSAMSWQDCFQLGHQLFKIRDFNHTIPWMKESLALLRTEDYHNTSDSIDFMEMVADYHQKMGDFENALNVTNRVLEMDPSREGSLYMKKHQEDMIARGPPPVKEKEKNATIVYRETNEFKIYEKLCRGEIKAEPWQDTPLRCRYFHRDVPYRLLMPFKMEEVNLDPYLVVFHDVIYDKEIATIKKKAKPTMGRSRVFNTEKKLKRAAAPYRTSQNAWLKYSSHRVLGGLLRRVHDISGLDMTYSEDLMVANYGIGGHYEPHFDFFPTDIQIAGNRIATAIFYLSDVEQGGATAFPFLKRAVYPRKGSLMFWYNLHRSVERDYRTKHAGCPVLKGSKWIANVWIRMLGQTFSRPCGLQPDHEVSLEYKTVI